MSSRRGLGHILFGVDPVSVQDFSLECVPKK